MNAAPKHRSVSLPRRRSWRLRGAWLLAALGIVVTAVVSGPASAAVVETWGGTVSAAGNAWATRAVTVSGQGVVRLKLAWPEPADLDLFLLGPDGVRVARATGAPSSESITYVTPGAGSYTVQVRAVTGSSAFTVEASEDPYVPSGATSTFTGTVGPGAPATYEFAVSEPGLVVGRLTWPEAATNLNLELRGPAGTSLVRAWSPAQPEVVGFDATTPGTYSWVVTSAAGTGTPTLTSEVPRAAVVTPPAWARDYGRYATADISPVDAVKDSTGSWWVVDEGLACLKKYAPDRRTVTATVFTCGTVGKSLTQMSRARGIGLDPRDNSIWMADTSADRLVKVSSAGRVLFTTAVPTAPGGPLTEPGDVVVDSRGFAYVHDQRDRIVKVSRTGAYVSQFGTSGVGPGQMRNAMSIAYSGVGGPHLYVTDSRNHQVDVWSTDGIFRRSFGDRGTADGQMTKDARGIAVDGAGTVYVADIGGNRIVKFTNAGVPLPSLGEGLPYNQDGGLDLAYGARGLFVDGGRLAISDMWNSRVLFWTLDGADTGLRIGGAQAPWDGHNEPRGVAVDAAGNVYVSDYWHQWIQKFAPDGTLLDHWGAGRGSDLGTTNLVGGIEVDNSRGYLYIANRENRDVDRWSLTTGQPLARLHMPAGPAFADGWPRDVAVDEVSGQVYAADEKNNQVAVFDHDGTVRTVITAAAPGSPLGTVNSVDVGPDRRLYVADAGNRRIVVYSPDGEYLSEFGLDGVPVGVEVAGSRVYVSTGSKVTIWSTSGVQGVSFGASGSADNRLNRAYGGMAVAPDGSLVIADTGNHRVKVYI